MPDESFTYDLYRSHPQLEGPAAGAQNANLSKIAFLFKSMNNNFLCCQTTAFQRGQTQIRPHS
jgi:hypothetical protein